MTSSFMLFSAQTSILLWLTGRKTTSYYYCPFCWPQLSAHQQLVASLRVHTERSTSGRVRSGSVGGSPQLIRQPATLILLLRLATRWITGPSGWRNNTCNHKRKQTPSGVLCSLSAASLYLVSSHFSVL